MKRILFSLACIAGMAFLASCQTMSKDECSAADWQVIGQQDGAAGLSSEGRFADHVKSCKKAGVQPDQTAYYAGYQSGLVQYCTPLKGLSVGQGGRSYNNVCPPDLEIGFMRGHRLGSAEYSKKSEIRTIETRIRQLEGEISDFERQVKKGKLSSGEAYDKIRKRGREIERLRRDRREANRELDLISRDIDWFTSNPDAEIPPRYN